MTIQIIYDIIRDIKIRKGLGCMDEQERDVKSGAKNGNNKGTKKVNDGAVKKETIVKNDNVPELKRFSKIDRNMTIEIVLNQHDIKYKNQIWGIPQREVEYSIEMINKLKEAKDTSDKFSAGQSEEVMQEERERAQSGKTRYMKVVSHANNIPYRARELAYVKVFYNKEKKLKSRVIVATEVCKDNKVNPDVLMNKIGEKLRFIVKS